ncbi:MAG: hypothetical protein IH948_02985, partial [Bacteroidetes bacterium]|nr:hypothetical protein [Bacteroidota bacterium]
MVRILVLAILSLNVLFVQHTSGQQQLLPLTRNVLERYDAFLNQKEVDFHSSIKPYVSSELSKAINVDSINHSLFAIEDSGSVISLMGTHLLSKQNKKMSFSLD